LNQTLQAELTISFLLVGGGIAGLACAIALRRVGHHVVVLEQSSDPGISKVVTHNYLRRCVLNVSLTRCRTEAFGCLPTFRKFSFIGASSMIFGNYP
jgi:heterodisulfide reductase subunit A-like polyferredoxin